MFDGTPTLRDIRARDELVASQEELLNEYRCWFGIDAHIVLGGCFGAPPTLEPTEAPEGAELLPIQAMYVVPRT